MSSIPTTDRGIFYPASTASTRLWEHFEALADSVETAMDTAETWVAWTPVWTTVFTSFGSGGVNEGQYVRTGDLVHAEFRCEIGSSPTIAAGTVQITLPVAVYGALPSGSVNQQAIGSWHLRDASGVWYYAGSIHTDVTTGASATATFSGSWNGSLPGIRMTNALPAAFAVGDFFSGTMTYRAA